MYLQEFFREYANKNVLVTGHTGFKGAWLSRWLLELGANVKGISLAPEGEHNLFEILQLEKKLEHQILDIRDFEKLSASVKTFSPDIVFHLAAQSLVRPSYEEPLSTFETNVMGTANLLEVIRKNPSVRAAVIVTTDKVYLNREWDYGYRENDPLQGKDPYSGSKAAADLVTQSYLHSFFQNQNSSHIAIARAGNVIGGGDWCRDRLVPDLIRAVHSNQELRIRNPRSLRPWQHVLDCLRGYLQLGAELLKSNEKIRNEAFNFGPDNESRRSVKEVVDSFSKYFPALKIKIEEQPNHLAKESGILHLSSEKAQSVLNWQPKFQFETAIKHTAEWYKSFYERSSDIQKLTSEQINLQLSS